MTKFFLSSIEQGNYVLFGIFILGLIVYIYKELLDGRINNKKVKIEAISLFDTVFKQNDQAHTGKDKVLIEQSILSIYGANVSYDEVLVLVKYRSPSMVMRKFINGRNYLSLNRKRTSFIFKNKYKSVVVHGKTFYWRFLVLLCGYGFFAFLGNAVLVNVYERFPDTSAPTIVKVTVFGLALFLLGIMLLLSAFQFLQAKSLLEDKKS